MSELPDLASLTHEQKDELIVALYHRLVALQCAGVGVGSSTCRVDDVLRFLADPRVPFDNHPA